MDIGISNAAFDVSTFVVVTYWSRDYVTISFMWIFELTNDICITYCDIYLLRSSLFSLFGHLIFYGHLNYLKNIWFVIVDIWPGKPILCLKLIMGIKNNCWVKSCIVIIIGGYWLAIESTLCSARWYSDDRNLQRGRDVSGYGDTLSWKGMYGMMNKLGVELIDCTHTLKFFSPLKSDE